MILLTLLSETVLYPPSSKAPKASHSSKRKQVPRLRTTCLHFLIVLACVARSEALFCWFLTFNAAISLSDIRGSGAGKLEKLSTIQLEPNEAAWQSDYSDFLYLARFGVPASTVSSIRFHPVLEKLHLRVALQAGS
jgi:hypothetical protein